MALRRGAAFAHRQAALTQGRPAIPRQISGMYGPLALLWRDAWRAAPFRRRLYRPQIGRAVLRSSWKTLSGCWRPRRTTAGGHHPDWHLFVGGLWAGVDYRAGHGHLFAGLSSGALAIRVTGQLLLFDEQASRWRAVQVLPQFVTQLTRSRWN